MEDTHSILAQLTAIKWASIVIVLLLAVVLLGAIAFAANVIAMQRDLRTENMRHGEQVRIERLLGRDVPLDAKFAALEWLAELPKHPPALMLLARSHYQLGELAKCREVLFQLLDIAPDYDLQVKPWLDAVANKLSQSKPRSVE